jgi:hypothetical protein
VKQFDEVHWQAIPEADGTHRLWGLHYGDDYGYGTKEVLIGFGSPRKNDGNREKDRETMLRRSASERLVHTEVLVALEPRRP